MKNHTRWAVAFIAGKILAKNEATSVYDFTAGQHIAFSGTATKTSVNVYDHKVGCHISGNSGSLYHFGNGKHIDITFNANQFSGYDYDTGKHYSGRITGNSISIYDHGVNQYFSYSV